MLGEYFHVRRLLWDDLGPLIRASEAEELRRAIGNSLIDENDELKRELTVLVEILAEYQQQSDCIRDALLKRREQRVPEPPGRSLLLEKLKLLAMDLRARNAEHRVLQSSKEQELLKYVLSADDSPSLDSGRSLDGLHERPPLTPRMADLNDNGFKGSLSSAREAVLLRPGTSGGKRPSTASTSLGRPVSRGSTLSTSSVTSSIAESPELRQRLNVDEIDSIKDDVQEALVEERQQLLEDIDFIQGCIEMEQDLLDDDRRQIDAVRPPPSLHELQELRRVLEKSLEDQDNVDRVESITSRTESVQRMRRQIIPATTNAVPLPTLPRPPPRLRAPRNPHGLSSNSSDTDDDDDTNSAEYRERRASRLPHSAVANSSSNGSSGTKVLKIRHAIQEARDEPFLT